MRRASWDPAGQSAKKLSGGETVRMALCRILMRRYDLLILDKPTTAMDLEPTLTAEKLICETCRGQSCALVLITHSISQARRIADRVTVLRIKLLFFCRKEHPGGGAPFGFGGEEKKRSGPCDG